MSFNIATTRHARSQRNFPDDNRDSRAWITLTIYIKKTCVGARTHTEIRFVQKREGNRNIQFIDKFESFTRTCIGERSIDKEHKNFNNGKPYRSFVVLDFHDTYSYRIF